MVRAAALLALLALLAVYYASSESLFEVSTWGDVAILGLVLMPALFALTWLALPFRRAVPQGVLGGAIVALAALAVVFSLAGLDVAANFAKFAAVTAAGWWFLAFFEAVSWVLLVALLIVPVDIYSVFRGPTKVIVEQQPEVFNALSIAFPLPGEHNSAQLGLPDVLFFALFLGAAVRFGLRPGATWVLMTLSFGLTLALAVVFEIGGLPALPLLSAAFVLANADLLWRRVRGLRVAALYDVHGNLPALEAVLAEVDRSRVDLVLVGGDVANGPMPRQCLERLRALGDRAVFVRGNGDRELAAPAAGDGIWAARARWAAEQLDAEQRSFLAQLPETSSVRVRGLGGVVFCHGSPRSDEEIVTALSSESRVASMLEDVTARTVVSGHTHVQFDRVVGETRLVNPGSVGMPYEARPGAYWALLGPDVELRRTPYDAEAAAAAIRATGFPEAEELARENVLATPDPYEAAEHFERLATDTA
ncbi:MAG TPA: metallophosphoesterase family protein [Gaiellaceae bacterium]|nr:metallophosphoesterase family protein [Gaiellaceae bacterium]